MCLGGHGGPTRGDAASTLPCPALPRRPGWSHVEKESVSGTSYIYRCDSDPCPEPGHLRAGLGGQGAAGVGKRKQQGGLPGHDPPTPKPGQPKGVGGGAEIPAAKWGVGWADGVSTWFFPTFGQRGGGGLL